MQNQRRLALMLQMVIAVERDHLDLGRRRHGAPLPESEDRCLPATRTSCKLNSTPPPPRTGPRLRHEMTPGGHWFPSAHRVLDVGEGLSARLAASSPSPTVIESGNSVCSC